MRPRNNDTPESVVERLWQAFDRSPFNRQVVKRLAQQLELLGEADEAQDMFAWAERLDAVSTQGHDEAFGAMRSGRLLKWLAARAPGRRRSRRDFASPGGTQRWPTIRHFVAGPRKRRGQTADHPRQLAGRSQPRLQDRGVHHGRTAGGDHGTNTLHFVRVTPANYVDKLNQSARQSPCDWLLLAEAGDEFTAGGLLRAGLELMPRPNAERWPPTKFSAMPNGALVDVFRPGFNLDLLQSLPSADGAALADSQGCVAGRGRLPG